MTTLLEIALLVVGGAALALGSGLIFLALLAVEEGEDGETLSRGWRMRHAVRPDEENQTGTGAFYG